MEMETLIGILFIYFTPSIIGCTSENHPNQTGLFMVNLFLGWTFFGWVCSLAWSFSRKG